jgi:membrane protein DedA with SNARE-associated domain
MDLALIIKTFGYPAIFVGTFLEGETILVLAGFAAFRGYLNLPLVITAAFLGTFAGDQLYFYLGRRHAQAILNRFPRWQSRLGDVKRLIDRYRILFILGFRFTYGLRTISPFVIGMSRVPTLLYVLLNGISALAWAILVGGGGYLLGNAMQKIIGDIKDIELGIMGIVAIIGGTIWLIKVRRDRKKYSNRNKEHQSKEVT